MVQHQTEPPRNAWSYDEFCYRHDLSRNSIYNEISRGNLKTIVVGRRRLITVQQEAAWLLKCEEAAQ